jgi:hypothetical protein
MQPRTLDQIIAELQPSYQPSIEFLRQRQAEIPKTVQADIQAAEAAQTKAYEDILTGARRRGLGFAGIPLGEQAQYASTVFAPEVLRARTRGTEAARDLEGSILGIQSEMRNAAIGRRQTEQDMAAQIAERQRQEAVARSSGGGGGIGGDNSVMSSLLSALYGGGVNTQQPKALSQQRKDKGFDFADISGNSISAGKYAQLTGQSIGSVLYNMGQSGDTYAQNLYNQLKRDPFFGKGNAAYDARIKQAYSPIFWGT